jgi:hypothetical protein
MQLYALQSVFADNNPAHPMYVINGAAGNVEGHTKKSKPLPISGEYGCK